MKQITNKEYEEWQKYKEEKRRPYPNAGHPPLHMCCQRHDPTKIGQHFLEVLPKISPGGIYTARGRMICAIFKQQRSMSIMDIDIIVRAL